MRPLVAVVLLCLCSCAGIIAEDNRRRSESEETRKMRAWVGHDVREMVSEYGGPPQERHENGSTTLWIWVFSGGVVTNSSGGSSALYGNHGGGSWGNSTQSTTVVECREWVDVDANGVIVAGHWRGNCTPYKRWPPQRAKTASP